MFSILEVFLLEWGEKQVKILFYILNDQKYPYSNIFLLGIFILFLYIFYFYPFKYCRKSFHFYYLFNSFSFILFL